MGNKSATRDQVKSRLTSEFLAFGDVIIEQKSTLDWLTDELADRIHALTMIAEGHRSVTNLDREIAALRNFNATLSKRVPKEMLKKLALK